MAFAFLAGYVFASAQCLDQFLILASTTESIIQGVILLSFYSLGAKWMIPFILSGYLIQKFILISKNLKKKMNVIEKTGGTLLLLTGFLIITDQLQILGFYLLEYLPFLGKNWLIIFSGLLNTINITPMTIIAPPINNSLVGSSPSRKIAAKRPVGGIPIVTMGSTLYKGLF